MQFATWQVAKGVGASGVNGAEDFERTVQLDRTVEKS
jgi:hypothetical protein